MNERKTNLDATTPDRLVRFATGVAASAMMASTVDAPGPADTHRGVVEMSQVPPAILHAIDAATHSLPVRQVACGMLAMDSGEIGAADDSVHGRLDRAIARAMLDAWSEGHCSAEAVGAAYALAADRVVGEPPRIASQQRLAERLGGDRADAEAVGANRYRAT
jgi:hypothetical protein